MKKIRRYFVIEISCFLLFLLFSCSGNDSDNTCPNAETFTINDFTGLDGCQWVLSSTSIDRVLEPINLFDFFDAVSDGQEIQIEYTARPDMASICQAGEIVEITCLLQ